VPVEGSSRYRKLHVQSQDAERQVEGHKEMIAQAEDCDKLRVLWEIRYEVRFKDAFDCFAAHGKRAQLR
jgi:hypothetical protein